MLTGQNGILNRAGEAKEKNGIAQKEEALKISVMDALSNGLGEITDSNLKKALNNNLGTEGEDYEIVGSEESGWTVTIKENEKDYKISSKGEIGEIEKVEGNKSDWEVEGNAVVKYLGKSNDIVIPNYVDGVKITEIGDNIFQNSEKTGTLKISEGIKVIGENAFENAKFIGNLALPSTLQEIKSNAFAGCSGFTGDLIIPNNVKNIKNQAFLACTGFNGILKISSSIEKIDNLAFQMCTGLTGDLIIPPSTKEIGEFAFAECSGFTGNLIIPDNVTVSQLSFPNIQVEKTIYIGSNVKNMNLLSNLKAKRIIMNSIIGPGSMTRLTELESYWISSKIIENINDNNTFSHVGSIDAVIYTDAKQSDSNWPENWNPCNLKVVYNTSLDKYHQLTD